MLCYIFLILVVVHVTWSNNVILTEPKLAGSIFKLNCSQNQSIIISQIQFDPIHSNDTECIDLNNIVLKRSHCNGAVSCDYPLYESVGNGENCNFKSRYARILYFCVPNGEGVTNLTQNAYDICKNEGQREIFEPSIGDGFILSPNFPNDYGDKRKCIVDIKLPPDSRLVIYLLKMNIEDRSRVNERFILTDYLTVSSETHYGSKSYSVIYNSTHGTTLSFITNFITMTHIPYPKGFILYYTILLENETPIFRNTESYDIPTLATNYDDKVIYEAPKVVDITVESKNTAGMGSKIEKTFNKAMKKDLSLIDQAILNRKIILFVCTIIILVALLGILLMGILYIVKKRHETPYQNDNYYFNDANTFDILKQIELARALSNTGYFKRNTRNPSQFSDLILNEATLKLLENKSYVGLGMNNYLDDDYYLCPIETKEEPEGKNSEETYEKLN